MKGVAHYRARRMFDGVVIAVDGSDEAKRAARRGIELAQGFDATVDVLSVIEQKTLRLTETADEKRQLRERGEAALAEITELASALGHPVSTKLTEGKPAVEISEFANQRDADLIVVGRQGLSGIGRRLLGGVTEQVLHRSDLPVLVVPGVGDGDEQAADYSRVLVTTDGSDNADVAIPPGIAIAQRFDSTLHVLNVVDLQAAGGVFHAGGLEEAFIERLETEGQAAVDRVAERIEQSAPGAALETAVERTASFGGAAAGIRDYVEQHEIDLVVMGSHGRSNLKRQLLGSVASTVLRSIDVPMLVVKRGS